MKKATEAVQSECSSDEQEERTRKNDGHKGKRKLEQDELDAEDESEEEGNKAEGEEEVLSHAAQRRQKKKQKLHKEDTDKTTVSKPASTSQARQNSVWVGNLAFKTNPDRLRGFFDGVGEITRIHMPTKTVVGDGKGMRGENRGFAYVDFAAPEAKKIAISYSEKLLDGRRLLIKDGSDFAGRPIVTPTADSEGSTAIAKGSTGLSKVAQEILREQKQPAGPTLFMGNLGFETTEESIREMIEAHQTPRGQPKDDAAKADLDTDEEVLSSPKEVRLRKVRMGTFEDSGLCKGFAFLDFITPEYATAALVDLRNHHLNGRKLVLEYASPDAVRRGGGPRPKTGKEVKGGYRPVKKTKSKETSFEDVSAKKFGGTKGDEETSRLKLWNRSTDQGGQIRSKPGAALALAHREKVAIVQSEGKKIVF